MKIFSLIVGLTLSWTVAAQGPSLAGQGLPLPWPFPWAKDCPVDWKDMEGRYVLSESAAEDEIDLKISVMTNGGLQVVRIFRYNNDGKMIAAGFNFVSAEQRILRLTLFPLDKKTPPVWAVIKLHYQSKVFSCAEDQLVPILTLEQMDEGHPAAAEYRLIKREPHN